MAHIGQYNQGAHTMTAFDRTVKRRTVEAYRVTVTGAYPDRLTGRKLVVELTHNGNADLVRIRESGRRTWVELDVAGLYRRGLIAQAKQNKKGK